jgi:plastocyanin
MTTRVFIAALAVVGLLVTGCGKSNTTGSGASSTTTGQRQQAAPTVTLVITIANGTVTPTNAELQAKAGQPIELRVNSDAADELHVHSVPDHTFKVEPKPGQTFQFTVDVPGQVEIELHKLQRTVATLQVQK